VGLGQHVGVPENDLHPAGLFPRVASLLPAGLIPRVASLLPAGLIPRVASLLPAGLIPRVAGSRVAEVDEDHPAVIPTAGHPPREAHDLPGIGGPQRTRGMTAQH